MEYKQFSLLDKIYDEEMSEENCTKIIDNLIKLLGLYVYFDIAKNPPPIKNKSNYHHKPIDLKEELSKVSIKNRKFYEFYQEIQKILTATRDLHFNILAHQTHKGIKFSQYNVYLPLNFDIRKDDNNNFRVFIKKNKFTENATISDQNFINSHLNIPLKKINGIDPFDYIQNWSKYKQTKNFHSQFTFIIDLISYFPLCFFPVEYSELYNEYEFDDNRIIKLFYLNNFEKVNDNDVECNNYFLKAFKSQKIPFEMPYYDLI